MLLCLSSGTDLKKSRHVLKSLSLCNKVLSYLISLSLSERDTEREGARAEIWNTNQWILKKKGGGGGRGGEEKNEKRKRKKGKNVRLWKKKKMLPVLNIPGAIWRKPECPGKKNINRTHREPY